MKIGSGSYQTSAQESLGQGSSSENLAPNLRSGGFRHEGNLREQYREDTGGSERENALLRCMRRAAAGEEPYQSKAKSETPLPVDVAPQIAASSNILPRFESVLEEDGVADTSGRVCALVNKIEIALEIQARSGGGTVDLHITIPQPEHELTALAVRVTADRIELAVTCDATHSQGQGLVMIQELSERLRSRFPRRAVILVDAGSFDNPQSGDGSDDRSWAIVDNKGKRV